MEKFKHTAIRKQGIVLHNIVARDQARALHKRMITRSKVSHVHPRGCGRLKYRGGMVKNCSGWKDVPTGWAVSTQRYRGGRIKTAVDRRMQFLLHEV